MVVVLVVVVVVSQVALRKQLRGDANLNSVSPALGGSRPLGSHGAPFGGMRPETQLDVIVVCGWVVVVFSQVALRKSWGRRKTEFR